MSFDYVQFLTNGNLQSILQSAATSTTAKNLLDKIAESSKVTAVGDSFASKIEAIRAYKNDLDVNMAKTTAILAFFDCLNDIAYESEEFDELVSVEGEQTLDTSKMRSKMAEEALYSFATAYNNLFSVTDVITITTVDGHAVCIKLDALSNQNVQDLISGDISTITPMNFVAFGGTEDEELYPALVITRIEPSVEGGDVSYMLSIASKVIDIEGNELTFSFFDLEAQLATSDTFNTCVSTACEMALRGRFEFNEFKALLSSRIPTEAQKAKEKINSLVSQIGEAALKGGLYGVISYLLRLISSPASIQVVGGVLTFTTNADLVPKEYIVGSICTIVGTLTSVVGAILTAVSPYIGIAVSLIGSLVGAIPQMINYDYDQNTLPYYNEDYKDGAMICCPFSVYRLTLTPTSIDTWLWKMSEKLRDTGLLYYCYVPGALVLFGLMTSKPGEIRVNLDFHPLYEDNISYFNEKVWHGATWENIGPVTGFQWKDDDIVREFWHTAQAIPLVSQSDEVLSPFEGTIDFLTAVRSVNNVYLPAGRFSLTDLDVYSYWLAARRPNKLFSPYDNHLISSWADVFTRLCVLGNIGLLYLWLAELSGDEYDFFNIPMVRMIYDWGHSDSWSSSSDEIMWDSMAMFPSAVADLIYWNKLLEQAGTSMSADVNVILEKIQTQEYIVTGSGESAHYTDHENRFSWSMIIGRYYDVLIQRPVIGFTVPSVVWTSDPNSTWPVQYVGGNTFTFDVGSALSTDNDPDSPLWSASIPIGDESPSWGILLPKYNRGTFRQNVAVAAVTTILVTAVTIITVLGVRSAIIKKRLSNQAKVENAWSELAADPNNKDLQKKYLKTVKKANRWQRLIGGTRFDKTNYWDSGTPESSFDVSSAGEDSQSLLDSYKSDSIVDDNESSPSLTSLYMLLCGEAPVEK